MSAKKIFIILISLILFLQEANAQEEKWISYKVPKYVRDFAFEGDYIWIGTRFGIVKWNKKTGQYIRYTTSDGLINNWVNAVVIDSEGNKWIGTGELFEYGANACKFDGETWTSYTFYDGLYNNQVFSIAINKNGDIWFGGDTGVSKYDGNTWTSYSWLKGDSIYFGRVQCIAFEQDSIVWLGQYGGISKFDGKSWIKYRLGSNLNYNDVKAVAIDADGTKWFGTRGGGVFTFDGFNWASYGTEDGLVHSRVQAIKIDSDGNKWFGTYGGVSKFDGNTWTNYKTTDGLVEERVYAIAIEEEGIKWFGTDGGVSVFGSLSDFPTVITCLPDIVNNITIPDDSSIVTLNYLDDASLSFNFTSGDVANHNISIKKISSLSDDFTGSSDYAGVPEFDKPVFYYDMSIDVSDFEVELTFKYTDDFLAYHGIEEDSIVVCYYDCSLNPRGNIWHVLSGAINKEFNTITVTVDQFSLFAITGNDETLVRAFRFPQDFRLYQNYPNPFNLATTIRYALTNTSHVQLTIYNILGQKVKTLVNEPQSSGEYFVIWNGTNDSGLQAGSGVYLCKLKVSSFSETKKIILIK
ncbi:hypothetical protein AMJ80_05010 [bacterium SM23_31]|nr:MAG: hypothetical protein AMJ80_05010 [bacterium SM23_31]